MAAKANKSVNSYVWDAVSRQIAEDQDGADIPNEVISNLIDWLRNHGHNDKEVIECLENLGYKTKDS